MNAPRLAVVVGLGFALAGCPEKQLRPPPPGTPERDLLIPEVAKLSSSAEALLRDQDERLWESWTAGKPAELDASYKGKETLTSPESIAKVERLRQLTDDAVEIRALTYLRTYLVGEALAADLSEANDALANLEASLTYTVDQKEYAYRDLERDLAAPDTSTPKRRAIYAAATEAVQRLTPTLRRREERIAQLLVQLHYPSYEAFGAELRQVDLDRLALLSEEILQLTQGAYTQVMDALARRELQLPLDGCRRADFPRLFQPRGVDALFPRDALLKRTEETVAGLGFSLSSLRNLRLDAEARKGKSLRPLAIAPRVPDDVRLSVTPGPGVRLQEAYLHEVGHALHLAFTTEKRFELAKLGGNAQAEAFAYLFADLIEDPVWLEEKVGLGGEKLQAYLYATGAHRLYRVRRAAGRLLYQLELRRRGGEAAKELYAAIMTRTYGVEQTPEDTERYLVDTEDFFQSADEFRAWILAAQLQGQLKARFGPRWWTSKDAGAFLQSLWAHGNALAARELAVAMGEDGMRPDVLLLRLASTLNVSIKLRARMVDVSPPSELPDAGMPDAGSP